MQPKYQGFSPLGILLGLCAVVLAFGIGVLFDLGRGATFFVLVGTGLVLFVGAAWRSNPGSRCDRPP
jgi:hypothetical protein